ncbi:MAG: hypothetical protein HOP29_17730 [Phycisphaerales bacterium]|nr:hypothetical protein [Phycisphaerales bacterium]
MVNPIKKWPRAVATILLFYVCPLCSRGEELTGDELLSSVHQIAADVQARVLVLGTFHFAGSPSDEAKSGAHAGSHRGATQ